MGSSLLYICRYVSRHIKLHGKQSLLLFESVCQISCADYQHSNATNYPNSITCKFNSKHKHLINQLSHSTTYVTPLLISTCRSVHTARAQAQYIGPDKIRKLLTGTMLLKMQVTTVTLISFSSLVTLPNQKQHKCNHYRASPSQQNPPPTPLICTFSVFSFSSFGKLYRLLESL